MDSDDNIKLEIRKFLAEKSKEFMSGSEIQGRGPTTLGPGIVPRPEPLFQKVVVPALALQPGMCMQSQRGWGTPQPDMGLRGGPGAPVGLCLSQGHPQVGETVILTKTRAHKGQGLLRAFGQPSSCAEAGTG